jgi:hypothetical protein
MELTDSERAEFNRLANDTFDAEIWDEADYPILKEVRAQYESEQSLESDTLPTEQSDIAEDDEGTWPDPSTADDA